MNHLFIGAASTSLVISSVDAISNQQYRVNVANSNSEIGVISLKLNGASDIEDNCNNKVILLDFEAYFLNNEVLSIENFLLGDNIKIYSSQKNNLRIQGLKLSKDKTTVKIYSLLGIEVLKKAFETNIINNVELLYLKTGTYVIQLKNSNGSINKKIIIE